MRQSRTLRTWIFAVLTFLSICLLPQRSRAQCSGSIQTQVYSQTYSSSGGNNYSLTVPQYSPPTGYSLVAAVYSSVVSTTATLSLQNTNNVERDFTPDISRTDIVKLNATTITGKSAGYGDYDFTALAPMGNPGDHITYGPDQIYNNTSLVYDSITSPSTLNAAYTGSGNLSITYGSTFFVNDVPSDVTYSTTLSDQVALSFTYYICSPVVLSADFVSFTASREDGSQALLKWSVGNEEAGRVYSVQVSSGGTDFVDISSQPSSTQSSSADYTYTYTNRPGMPGKLYFRIKQTEAGGSTSYSNICAVDFGDGDGGAFSIYPNPVSSGNFITLSLPGDSRSWQVEIFSADGNLVQRSYFTNTSLATMNFDQRMATGTYFVRASNALSGDVHTESFVVTP